MEKHKRRDRLRQDIPNGSLFFEKHFGEPGEKVDLLLLPWILFLPPSFKQKK